MKEKIFNMIKVDRNKDKSGKNFDRIVVGAIIINLIACIIETFEVGEFVTNVLLVLETATVVFFTIEYILRIYTAEYLYPRRRRHHAKIKYIFSFWGIIDFLSFFPFYLPFFFPNGIMVFRMFRIMRMARLFNINRTSDALDMVIRALKSKRRQLTSSVFIIIVLLVASSLLMYDIEHEAQPEVFENAFSALWWATSAIFTIGYGDIYPITIAGRIMAIVISILGVGLVAIPTGIIFAGFVEQIEKVKGGRNKYCPHCGERLQ